jgi:hypothetical protein
MKYKDKYRIRAFKPGLPKEYTKLRRREYISIAIMMVTLLLNTFGAAYEVFNVPDPSYFSIFAYFIAMAASILSAILAIKSLDHAREINALDIYLYDTQMRIWKYLWGDGPFPTIEDNVLTDTFSAIGWSSVAGGSNALDIDPVVYKKYLQFLEKALDSGLPKSRFLKLKMQYG